MSQPTTPNSRTICTSAILLYSQNLLVSRCSTNSYHSTAFRAVYGPWPSRSPLAKGFEPYRNDPDRKFDTPLPPPFRGDITTRGLSHHLLGDPQAFCASHLLSALSRHCSCRSATKEHLPFGRSAVNRSAGARTPHHCARYLIDILNIAVHFLLDPT